MKISENNEMAASTKEKTRRKKEGNQRKYQPAAAAQYRKSWLNEAESNGESGWRKLKAAKCVISINHHRDYFVAISCVAWLFSD